MHECYTCADMCTREQPGAHVSLLMRALQHNMHIQWLLVIHYTRLASLAVDDDAIGCLLISESPETNVLVPHLCCGNALQSRP